MFKYYLISLIAYSLFSVNSIAQESPHWEDYIEFNVGLVFDRVNDFVKDSNGKIWLLTPAQSIHLNQDPNHFQRLNDGYLPSHIEIDQYDTLWMTRDGYSQVNTPNGIEKRFMISYYNGEFKDYYLSDYIFPDQKVKVFKIDESGNKWYVFGDGGIGKLDTLYQYTEFSTYFGAQRFEAVDIAIHPITGELHAIFGKYIYRFDEAAEELKKWTPVAPPSIWINALLLEKIAFSPDGKIYTGGYNGLHIITHTASDTIVDTYNMSNSNIPFNLIADIKFSPNDKLVLAGYNSTSFAYVVDENFNILYKSFRKGSSPTFPVTINIDSTNLWIGTAQEGMIHINDSGTYFYNDETISLPTNHGSELVNSVSFTEDKIFISTHKGLTIKKDSLFEGIHPLYSNPPADLPGDGKTNDVLYDENSIVYIATDSGLALLDPVTYTTSIIDISTYPQLISERFLKLFFIKTGSIVALTPTEFIIFENGLAKARYTTNNQGVPTGTVWNDMIPEFMGSDLSGLWIATDIGFYYYDFTQTIDFNSEAYHSNVASLTEDSNGILWLGFDTYGEKIQSFDKVSVWTDFDLPELSQFSISSQSVVDLKFDSSNNLWLLANYRTSGSTLGSKLLNYINGNFSIIEKQRPINSYSVSLNISPGGDKWISNYEGLFIYYDSINDSPDLCEGIACPADQVCFNGGCFDDCTENNNNICIDLGPNRVADAGAGVILDAGDGFDHYTWSTGETTQSIIVYTSDRYWATAFDFLTNLYSTDTANILIRSDPDGNCPDGMISKNGFCYAIDNPCADIICPAGQVCIGGGCFDECLGGECDINNICFDNECYENAPCDNVVCPSGQTCFNGGCFDDCTENNSNICLDLGPNRVADAGAGVILDAGDGFDHYTWSTGETTQSIIVYTSDRYWATAFDFLTNLYSTDTANILIRSDPDGNCPDGMISKNGFCYAIDNPCADIICPAGQVCIGGGCFDECLGGECDINNICFDNECYENAPCDNVVCPSGQACFNGGCFDDATGDINRNSYNSEIKLYPNPTNGNVTIEYGEITDTKISIFNITGNIVYTVNVTKKAKVVLPVANIPSGVYYIKIQTNKQQRTIKLIKN